MEETSPAFLVRALTGIVRRPRKSDSTQQGSPKKGFSSGSNPLHLLNLSQYADVDLGQVTTGTGSFLFVKGSNVVYQVEPFNLNNLIL